ncbi:NAD(P)H-binding protein [Micromonospora sp. NBC_01699]|uniref:NmrA family NAD(P)-binding protein n=1 Tax=Micromonospora sp. NBC_01699 TaxID=2975984 RepID=UPI002E338635|nr:NAD(P)H-binding protein [Micromonospora sp. NBC_01699]
MTTDVKDILVIGGTGKIGRRLVRTLRASGRPVRAASRSGERRFDWSEPSTWLPAVEGISAVYLMAPEDPKDADDFVTLATESGVSRFVALSGRGIDQIEGDFSPGMLAAEQAVRDSGVEWTIIRPNNFNQNFDEDLWRQPLRDGRLGLPIGVTPEPFVDAQDVADVAALLLTTPSDSHHGQVYDLTGPEALTFATVVATIAEAAGRSIRYDQLTPDQYRTELLAQGYPEETAAALNVMFAGMRAGHLANPTDTVRRLLRRPPTTFNTYAARAATTGAWS